MLQEYLSLGIMQRKHFSLDQINSALDFMGTLTSKGKILEALMQTLCAYALLGCLLHITAANMVHADITHHHNDIAVCLPFITCSFMGSLHA